MAGSDRGDGVAGSGAYNLDKYILVFTTGSTLYQPYDIAQNGAVTVD